MHVLQIAAVPMEASVWQPVLRKLVRGGFWELRARRKKRKLWHPWCSVLFVFSRYLIAPDDSDGDQEACEGLVTLGHQPTARSKG